MSNVDYDDDLALPMPKTRLKKSTTPDLSHTAEKQQPNNPAPKTRASTDPVKSTATTPKNTLPASSASIEGKKPSRFGRLRSKLSFRDLRKETDKHGPVQPDPKSATQTLPLTVSAMPTYSSGAQSSKSKAKVKPDHEEASSIITSTKETTAKTSYSTTRIPSPPVSCVNAQGTMIPTRAPTTRKIRTPESRSENDTDSAVRKESSTSPIPIPSATPDAHRELASGEQPTTSDPKSNLSGNILEPYDPVTNEAPPSIGDLAEGDGRVRYLPESWLEEAQISLDSETKSPIHRSYSNKASASSLPSYVPTFRDRLEMATASALSQKAVQNELQNCQTPMQIDNIVDIVRSIQRRADFGTAGISKKVEELSDWIGDQLKNQIESIADLGRTNSDLFNKQCQISREMMKFQLDIRLQMGILEKRMDALENDLLNDIQTEVRALARSYEDLGKKTEALVEKETLAFSHSQAFMDQQLLKIAQIEKEIAYLKSRQECNTSIILAPEIKAPLEGIVAHKSETSVTSTEPLIRKPTVIRPPPHGGPHRLILSSTTNHPTTAPEAKPTGLLPRSISISRRGLLQNLKDISSSSLKNAEKNSTDDDNKKWNIPGWLRRRQTSLETSRQSNASRLPWSGSRQFRKAQNEEEVNSSRSSTPPVPPIPRHLAHAIERLPTPPTTAHPAFRNRDSQTSDSPNTSYNTAWGSNRASLPRRVSRSFDVSSSPPFPDQDSPSVRAKSIVDRPVTPPLLDPVHDNMSPDTVIQNCDGDDEEQVALSSPLLDVEVEWDRVSSNEKGHDGMI